MLRITLLVVCIAPLVAFAQEPVELQEQQAFKEAAETVAPSVVQIQTFGGLDRVGDTLTGTGPTSGIVLSVDGFLMTSAFSFAAKPAAVVVRRSDGRQYDAEVVATDYSRMLTLLKIDADDLPIAEAAPLDEARVGHWTLAVGKAYDVATPNASPGILSAKNRIWGKAIQTDAKTSPVNYGGPLIDIRGRILGVIVPLSMTSDEVMAGAEWYDSGIGFAVPMEQVLASAERLKTGEDQYRGTMGVVTTEPGKLFAKPVVASVREDTSAEDAGLTKGDVIVALDGEAIDRQSQILQILGPKYAGDQVEVIIRRGDDEQTLTITLEKPTKTSIAPQQQPTQQPGEDEGDPSQEQPAGPLPDSIPGAERDAAGFSITPWRSVVAG